MKLKIVDIAVFAILAALMFATKQVMAFLPNIHLLGVFIIAATVIYRAKALIPIYLYVFLDGLFNGFSPWWISYLYIWAILWLFAMLIPKKLPSKLAPIIYSLVCGFHGLIFGTLCAPMQMIFFDLDFKETIAWIIVGLPYDAIHAVSNFTLGFLICPIIHTLNLAQKGIK